MADTSTNSTSPFDLGKLIIDGNHAMLSNQSTSGDQSQQFVQKNPTTNLTDDQASALAAVIKAANKDHATEAYQQMGHDNAAALVALHNMTSPSGGTDSSSGGSISTSSSQAQAKPSQPQQQSNFNPLALLHNLVQGVVDIIPTSPQAKIANSQVALNRMTMDAGLPADIALPQAQAQEAIQRGLQTKQQISGLTPEQQAQAQGGYNTALIQQQNDAAQRLTSQNDSLQKQYDALKSTIPFGQVVDLTSQNKPIETEEMAKIRAKQNILQSKLLKINSGASGKVLANPTNKSFSSIEEAIKAKVPKGSIVNINGVPHQAN